MIRRNNPHWPLRVGGLVISALVLLLAARPAGATPLRHPMGNFTINHYAALGVAGNGITVRYVIDMAEIPAYQELGQIRPDHNTQLTTAERDSYVRRQGAALLGGLRLTVNDQPLPLQERSAQLSFPPGAGGLPTLRLDFDLFAPLPQATTGVLRYQDTNYAERIGWQEIIATAGAGGQIMNATVPTTDQSQALTVYPPELINDPPRLRETTFRVTTNGIAPAVAVPAAPTTRAPTGDWITGRMDALTELMTRRNLPAEGWLLALLIAFALGAAHALSPGHGKTVAAAYLVGSRGTPRHALILGISVTVTHTIGVFILGLITMYAAQFIVPDKLYPWISVISGIVVLVLGVGLFRSRWRGLLAGGISPLPGLRPRLPGRRATARTASSLPQDDSLYTHTHDPAHATDLHQHGPGSQPHTHLPPAGATITLRSLIALGASGGLLPCPSALIVMLSAISFGQIGFGMVMILAFSVGLAAVLTGIGLLLLYARRLVERVPLQNGFFQRLPLVSALGVAGLGLVITVQALLTTGLVR